MISGNDYDLSGAAFYRKAHLMTARVLKDPKTYTHTWGIQEMQPGDVELVNLETSEVYGIEHEAFESTYALVQGKRPEVWRKKALIRAVRMTERFLVVSLDSETPEIGLPGDWLVENDVVRPDGRHDRYLLRGILGEEAPKGYVRAY